jgi:hypothetical protein
MAPLSGRDLCLLRSATASLTGIAFHYRMPAPIARSAPRGEIVPGVLC